MFLFPQCQMTNVKDNTTGDQVVLTSAESFDIFQVIVFVFSL